jgi:endonuclease YncB( thermonuclease family)
MKHFILFLTIVMLCFLCVDVKGASLFGKVIEVNSGDVITIFNLNRPVRVKLLGIDAPEMDQAFGDVAKNHLSDLVFDKGVLVQYSGIGADGSITGRVLLNDADIGAQMVRDGAAWFDLKNSDRLAVMDRDVYQQSEQAARSERRGLWQQANPISPWDFVKAQELKTHPVSSLKATESSTRVKPGGSSSELTNLALMTSSVKAALPSASTDASIEVLEGAELPSGLPFTALPPRNGTRFVKSTAFGPEIVKANGYFAIEGRNIYSVIWFTAPTYGEDDRTAMDRMIFNELIAGVAGAFTGGDPQARCSPQSEKDVSSNGYWGLELDMSECQIPTRLRVFTKVTNDRREVYLAMVTFKDEDANVKRFMSTFTIRGKKTSN